ncbi:hypothetical protein ACT7DN_14750 [Bacillus paranthracis]
MILEMFFYEFKSGKTCFSITRAFRRRSKRSHYVCKPRFI